MLEPALLHESELQKILISKWYDLKYKYYWNYSWRQKYEAQTSTWTGHEFVSVHNGEILGFFKYDIDRDSNVAYNLAIISFIDHLSLPFSRDLMRVFQDIFELYKIRKLRFSVLIGNPIETSYDRMCAKYGGRIIGFWRQEEKLIDGTYADKKFYEVMADDYFRSKERLA